MISHNTGKTMAVQQKIRVIAVGVDPSRPGYKFPIDPENRWKFTIWLICPPDTVRKQLEEIDRGIPRGIKRKVHKKAGQERIEFEPTELRPKGATIYVKSSMKSIDQFQYDVCHVIAYDEEPPQEIWHECQQRLIMTSGWTLISLTPVKGTTWLHQKLEQLDLKYQNLQVGGYAWFTANQFENPMLKREEIEYRSQGMTEDEFAVRVMGEYRTMAGKGFFPSEVLRHHRDHFMRTPSYSLSFLENNHGVLVPWDEQVDGWRVFKEPEAGEFYVIGADVAGGVGGDYAAAQVLSASTGEQVACYRDNRIEPHDFGIELGLAGFFFNCATVNPEVNFNGSAVLYALQQMAYPKVAQRFTYSGSMKPAENMFGWLTGKHNKWAACQALYAALKNAAVDKPGCIVRDELTLEELMNFWKLTENKHGSYGIGAITGHDDLVMALAIAFQTIAQSPERRMLSPQAFTRTRMDATIQKIVASKLEEQTRRDDEF